MRIDYDDVSTKMSREAILEQLFPSQETYRAITADILDVFEEKAKQVEGRHEIEVASIVKQLEEKGHNRNTVYKLLNEHLVPMGLVNWKKFEGSLQLSKRFGNALRNFSISWKNYIEKISDE